MKKIALIGNMNNNFFSIVRYLRDLGYKADLFLIDEIKHFLPNSDCYNDSYKEYTFELTHDSFSFNNKLSNVKEQLNGYDFIIGSGKVPAILSEKSMKLNMFIPHGQDLFSYPFYNKNFKLFFRLIFLFNSNLFFQKIFWKLGLRKMISLYDSYILSRNQLDGLRNTDIILSNNISHSFKSSIDKIGFDNKIIYSRIPILYYRQYQNNEYLDFKENFSLHKKLKIKKDGHLIIFHHSRHCWKNSPNKFFNNGNQLLFRGFKKFIDKYPDQKIKIVTLEYGIDVNESKNLIKKLNLEKYVFWLPILERKEIMALIPLADLGAATFSIPWTSGGVISEFQCLGIPFMQSDNNEIRNDKTMYPYFSTNTEGEICSTIEYSLMNPNQLKENGIKGQNWF